MMRSSWVPLVLLLVYLLSVFMVVRLLDLLMWCGQGVAPTDIVDPLLLSVRQLKQLLEVRGVSYTGCYEKIELAQLVESSADVSQDELEELQRLVGQEEKARLAKSAAPHTAHFSGSAHFYEQVEDTKDSVWLVQVVPASGLGEPLLDDYRWQVVRHYLAPFAIQTGLFDCRLDRRLCKNKGWNKPLLLLAMPKGTTSKDKVVIRTCAFTRPQQIITWMAEQLAIRVQKISSLQELEDDWLTNERNETAVDHLRDVKVLLLTHILHPPLFLAALSIKFTGRIRFGMMTVKKEEEAAVSEKLRQPLKTPSYWVVTPERTVAYGTRRGEQFNLRAMNAVLRVVQPDANDIFLCTLVLANMVAFLQIVQVTVSSWWKRLVCGIWTFVSYNLWLFAAWLLILGTHRWPVLSSASDQLLVIVRSVALSDIGNNLRNDCLLLYKHPLFFLASFLFFVFMTKRFVSSSSVERESEDRPWWELLPLDCLFRPMASLSRPLPPSEVQLEEGIELLIERLAVPNLWLQPSVMVSDYIKDLPVWRYKAPTELDIDTREIVNLMDSDNNHCKYDSSSEESLGELPSCPVKGMLPTSSCAVCLESYHNNAVLCGLPCGHNYHKRCIHMWLQTDNHHCPICRWPVYKHNHPRLKPHQQ